MSRLKKILMVVALATLSLSGCTKLEGPTQEEKKALSNHFHKVVNEYFEAFLALHPLFATSIGDHQFDDQLAISISQAHRDKQKELVSATLDHLQSIQGEFLEHQERLTYEMLTSDLETEKGLLDVDLDYLMPFNQFSSFFSDFAELASGMSFVSFDTQKDYENFLCRCSVVPEYIDVMIKNMQEGIEKGVTTPKVLVELGLKQLKNLLVPDYKDSLFYKPVLEIEKRVPGDTGKELEKRYKAMIQNTIYPAYQKLEEFVEKTYLSKARETSGLCEIPGGREFYLALLRSYTTTDLIPEQIRNMGSLEVKRLKGEFIQVKERLGFDGDLISFFDSLKQRSKELYPFTSVEQILDSYKEIEHTIEEKIGDFFHLQPKAPLVIKKVDSFKEMEAAPSYQPATEDGSRPGVFWVPIPSAKDYPAKEMQALFLHEAIPGHHFQISIQQELPNLPPYRRFMGNTAYIEGWALYSESLGKDLGLYKNPYQWIGRLTLDMHRAVRLIVDTGIHWFGWSREQAIEYSLSHEPSDSSFIIDEVNRYMALPGQAVSYKIGELRIQHLKIRAKDALAHTYKEWEFNDEVLKNGSLPLSVLDAMIDKFIADKFQEMQKGSL